ncbi:MAG: exosortase system-associated protein, TIGR04073 family [Gammaproteobacteria bacterium]
MKKGIPSLLLILSGCMFFIPTAGAQYMSQYSGPAPDTSAQDSGEIQESYGATVGRKFGSGASNMALGWIEIPKNTLNVSNDPDTRYALFGLVGGVIKGTLHAIGRTLTGVGDFVTAPLPTKSMIRSDYVWDDFRADTQYGPYFQLTDRPEMSE